MVLRGATVLGIENSIHLVQNYMIECIFISYPINKLQFFGGQQR